MLKVGLTADWDMASGTRKQVLGGDYFEWLYASGVSPVALPSLPGSEEAALEGLSALVLTGGGDIPPQLYGADPEPLPTEKFSHPERAAFEFALVWRCLRLRMPVLGICLGCQTINAALGGDLIRHLDDPRHRHRRAEPTSPHARHRIRVEADSLIEVLYPSPDTRVISSHHQSVGRLAPGWRVTAWGPDDVPEALEHRDHPEMVAVQWHPERSPGSRFSINLAQWLSNRAESYARHAHRS